MIQLLYSLGEFLRLSQVAHMLIYHVQEHCIKIFVGLEHVLNLLISFISTREKVLLIVIFDTFAN